MTAIGVTRGRLLQHYCDHGLEPGAQPVTNAVRASLAMVFPVDTSETGLTAFDVGAAEQAVAAGCGHQEHRLKAVGSRPRG